jgi:hypothetical protein
MDEVSLYVWRRREAAMQESEGPRASGGSKGIAIAALGAVVAGVALLVMLPRGADPEPAPIEPAEPTRTVKRFDAAPPASGAHAGPAPAASSAAPTPPPQTPPPAPSVDLDAEEPPPADAEDVAETTVHPLDVQGIRAAVREASKEIAACYDTYRESYPDASGRITVEFELLGRGDRTDVVGADIAEESAEESMDSVYLEGCVVTAMEDIRFEGTPEGEQGSVSWPFVFRSSDD